MKQQPDQLFHDKLRNYSKPVPGSAWERIDADISKKTYPFYKFGIAASVLLVSVCIYLLWPSSITEQKNIAQNPEQKLTEPIQIEDKSTLNEDTQEKQAEKIKTETTDRIKKKSIEKKINNINRNEKPQNDILLPETRLEAEVFETNSIAEINPTNNISSEKVDSVAVDGNKSENLFIVFTTDDTQEYLSENISKEATTEKKNASTLKRVLSKARKLKNNQDPFGDLRQMKNEILALNFKSEKERGQKK